MIKNVAWAIGGLTIGIVACLALAVSMASFGGCGGKEKEFLELPLGRCTEFWLNRYQQLLAGWLALVLAAVGTRVLMLQTQILKRQANVAEAAQHQEAYAHLEKYSNAGQDLAFFQQLPPNALSRLPTIDPDAAAALDLDGPGGWSARVGMCLSQMAELRRFQPVGAAIAQEWSDTAELLRAAQNTLHDISVAWDAFSRRPIGGPPRRRPGLDGDVDPAEELRQIEAERQRERQAARQTLEIEINKVPANFFDDLYKTGVALDSSVREQMKLRSSIAAELLAEVLPPKSRSILRR
ncbi:hypothetical protein ACWIGM_05565 [Bosea sp. NPDC055332]